MICELPLHGGAPGSVDYELVDFPFDVTLLTRSSPFDVGIEDMQQIASWLEQELPTRASSAESLLAALAAPEVRRDDPKRGLLALGAWLQGWMPLVMDPYVQKSYPSEPDWEPNWLMVTSGRSLGFGFVTAGWPHQARYSIIGDNLLHSLIVDLVALVMESARHNGASPHWSAEVRVGGPPPNAPGFQLVARVSDPPLDPLVHVHELLLQSVSPIRGERHRALRRRQSEFLADCYDQVVTGRAPEPIERLFPEFGGNGIGLKLKRPARSVPPAPPRLAEAAAKLIEVGLYESWKHDADDLARALQRQWQLATNRELPSDPDGLWTCLLLMDHERTWLADVDAGILGPGDQMYADTLFDLEGIGGRGFGGFSDPEEDWRSNPNSVAIKVRWRRKLRRFEVPQTIDGVLHPRLFEELNALLGDGGARFWFLDIGATVGVVIRLTTEERDRMSAISGLVLLDHPPHWWTQAATEGLSSLPTIRSDPLLLGDPVEQETSDEPVETWSLTDNDLQSVSITDAEVDGHLVFIVYVSAAEYIRGGHVEEVLEARVTAALRAAPGVLSANRADREQWEVTGDPNEAELELAVASAVESLLLEFADAIAQM